MKKKNLLLGLATALCVSCAFVGCGSKDESKNSTTETTTEGKNEASLLGYWEMKNSENEQNSVYYYFSEGQMEVIMMGMKLSGEAEITDTTITANMLGDESTISYELDGDLLKLIEDGETVEFNRISENDYKAVVESLESDNADNEDESEDSGVNGYVVEPGVEMTVTEDDGTVVIYANDGNGTYIKSTTPPAEDTEE